MQKLIISTGIFDSIRSPEFICVNVDGVKKEAMVTLSPEWGRAGNDIFIECLAPKFGNYFDIRSTGVSYSTKEPSTNEDGKWKREGRQIVKPSRLIAYLIKETGLSILGSFNEEAKKKIAQRFLEIKSESLKPFDLKQIKVSDNVSKIYNIPTSDKNVGSLGSSCMRPESDYKCNQYTSVYNDMGAKIAYFESNGFLVARALLWDDVKSERETKVRLMDRIYGSELSIESFKAWARENGYAYKASQNSEQEQFISPEGNKIGGEFTMPANIYLDDGNPYMDTFCYYNYGTLHTSGGDNMQNADGDEEEYECENCGATFDSEDYLYYCEESGVSACECCIVWTVHETNELERDCVLTEDNDWVLRSDPDYYELEDGTVTHIDKAFYCENCGEWHHVNDTHYIEEIEKDLCPNCDKDRIAEDEGYEIVNGEWVELETETK